MTRRSSLDMAVRGRIGGLTTAATHDGRAITAAARAAFQARWYADLPDDLSDRERERRARARRRAFYVRLARRSAATRARKARAER
jgi:hypothetical protein